MGDNLFMPTWEIILSCNYLIKEGMVFTRCCKWSVKSLQIPSSCFISGVDHRGRNKPFSLFQRWMCRIFISAHSPFSICLSPKPFELASLSGLTLRPSWPSPCGQHSSNLRLIWDSFVCNQRIHCRFMKRRGCAQKQKKKKTLAGYTLYDSCHN